MNWILRNLPLMVIMTTIILTILGVGMWLEYSKSARKDEEVRDNGELYLPHVAQGIRNRSDQSSVTFTDTKVTDNTEEEKALALVR